MTPFCLDAMCRSSLPLPLTQCGHHTLNGRCVRRCLKTSSLEGNNGTGGAITSLISSGSSSLPCAPSSTVSFGNKSSPPTSSFLCLLFSQVFNSGLMGQSALTFPACQKGADLWLAVAQERAMLAYGRCLYGNAFWFYPWLSGRVG